MCCFAARATSRGKAFPLAGAEVAGTAGTVGKLQATLMELMPGTPMMSRDNVLSMRVPNVASGRLPGLRKLLHRGGKRVCRLRHRV